MKLKTDWFPFGVLSPFNVSNFWDPMDYSLPVSSVHEILQARILEWVATPSSRGSSRPRDRTCVSIRTCVSMSPALAGGFFTISATWEAQFPLYSKEKIFLYLLSRFSSHLYSVQIPSPQSQLEDLKTSESPRSHCWPLLLPLQSPPSSVVKDILMLINPQTGLPLPYLASLCSF